MTAQHSPNHKRCDSNDVSFLPLTTHWTLPITPTIQFMNERTTTGNLLRLMLTLLTPLHILLFTMAIPLFLFFIYTTRNSRIRTPPNSKNVCFINFGPRQNTLITVSASFSLCFCVFVLTSFYPSFRSSRFVRLFLLSR